MPPIHPKRQTLGSWRSLPTSQLPAPRPQLQMDKPDSMPPPVYQAQSREDQKLATAFEKTDWEEMIDTAANPRQARLLRELASFNNDPVQGENTQTERPASTTPPRASPTKSQKTKSSNKTKSSGETTISAKSQGTDGNESEEVEEVDDGALGKEKALHTLKYGKYRDTVDTSPTPAPSRRRKV